MPDAQLPRIALLRATTVEMITRGHTDYDIGAVLRLDAAAVRRLLATQGEAAAALHYAAWSAARKPPSVDRVGGGSDVPLADIRSAPQNIVRQEFRAA